MAAIADTTGMFDCNSFVQKIQRALPSYARPVFLRISPHVDTTGMFTVVTSILSSPNNEISRAFTLLYHLCVSTCSCAGTFKIQKTRLQREGFDPRHTTDQIYVLNARAVRYDAVDDELYSAIVDGRMPL